MNEYFSAFRDYLLSLGISEGSIRNYLSDVNHFFSWLDRSYPRHGLPDLSIEHSLAYRTHLAHELEAPLATVNRRLSSLRQFFNWARSKGFVSADPMGGVTNISLKSEQKGFIATPANVAAPLPTDHRHNLAKILLTLVFLLLLLSGSSPAVKEKIRRTIAQYPKEFLAHIQSVFDPEGYKKTHPISVIVDVNDVFGYTADGKITPNLPLVFQGSPPFEVTSSDLVANLNSNFLEGHSASDFMSSTTDKWIRREGLDVKSGPLIVQDGFYVPLRIENFGGKNDFLVAQSNGKILFALQPGGDIWMAGTLKVANGASINGQTTLANLSVLGSTVFSGSLTVGGDLNVGGTTISAPSVTTFNCSDCIDFDDISDNLTLDASTTISADGTKVLTITNTGTGNSLVVNDDTSDTTPFVVDASGNVGIGTTNPNNLLSLSGIGSTVQIRLSKTDVTTNDWNIGYVSGSTALVIQPTTNASFAVKNSAATQILNVDTTSPSALTVNSAIVTITDASSFAADVGGNLSFRGLLDGSQITNYGAIKAGKANGTSGNTDAYLAFYSRSNANGLLERMRIDPSGNVGIGDISPEQALNIRGNIQLGDDDVASPYWLGIISSGVAQTGGVRYGTEASPASKWSIYGSSSDSNLHINMGATERVTIDSAGNVGIGDTSPDALLDVESAGSNQTLALFQCGGGFCQIIASNGTSTADFGADASGVYMGANSAHDLRLRTGALDRIFVQNSTGNVGIGDTTPASLFVVGDGDDFQISSTGAFQTSSVGPHAIGGATVSTIGLEITGTATQDYGVRINRTLSPGVGSDGRFLTIQGTINEAASGIHADFASLFVDPPAIVAGVAALTNASTLKITGAPTGATNNYALWVDAGSTRLDGIASISTTPLSNVLLTVGQASTHPGTTADLSGILLDYTAPSTATTALQGVDVQLRTAATAFTATDAFNLRVRTPILGAGSAITNTYGLRIANQGATGVTNAVGLYVDSQSGASSTNYAAIFAGGNVGIGTSAPGTTLDVTGTGRFSSTLTASNGLTLTTGALNLTSTSGALSLTVGGANALVDLKADDTARTLTINNSGSDTVGAGVPETKLVVKAGVNQTGNILELQNSAGTVVARFEPDGDLVLGSAGGGKLTAGVVDPHLIVNTGSVQAALEFRTTATAGADDFIFTLGGVEKARISEGGNLNIVGTLTAQSSSTSTFSGPIDMQNNIITNIGNAGTDFVASTGALNLAGVLTANGGIILGANQSLTATSGTVSLTGLSTSSISATSANLTLSTVTSGTLALTSAGALNLTAGSASTFTLANVANAFNFDADTLSIDALNNRVGIGTASPNLKLNVDGGGDITLSGASGFVTIGADAGFQLALDNDEIQAKSNNTTASILRINDLGGDITMVANGTGNVGVGTATPGAKLEIYNGNLNLNVSSIRQTTLAPPGAPTVAIGSATGITGTFNYAVTFITASGETEAGTVSLNVTVSNQKVDLSNIPTGTVGVVTARKIYRSTTGPTEPRKLVTTINDNVTTTYTDSTADGSLGIRAPSYNTTSGFTATGTQNLVLTHPSGKAVTIFDSSTNNIGKITWGTADPPYLIDGTVYATYVPAMIGVNEEIAGSATLSFNPDSGLYRHSLKLNEQAIGSDMWVFSRIIDQDISRVTILLTPNVSARVWYTKDAASRTITFLSDRQVEVSYRLTAPRFDHAQWGTLAEDQSIGGLLPPVPAASESIPSTILTGAISNASYTENYQINGALEVGDIAAISEGSFSQVSKSKVSYDARVVGVVVEKTADVASVAPAGKVLVKVSVENGSVRIGDYLTASSTQGRAMKATEAGRVIGKALQAANSDVEILVSLNLSWFDPDAPAYNSNGTVTSNQEAPSTFETVAIVTANITNLNVGTINIVDEQGNLKVNGNVVVTGKGTFAELRVDGLLVLYGGISAPNGLAVTLGQGQSLEVKDSTGASQAAITDQGSLLAKSVELGELKLSTTSSEPTTGAATFIAGGTAMVVETTKVTSTSNIIVTFKGDYAPATRYWISDLVVGSSFTINLDQTPSADVSFSWWVVN